MGGFIMLFGPPLALFLTLVTTYSYMCSFDRAVDFVVKYLMSGPFLIFFHTASTVLFSRFVPGSLLP
jgi:hypothetical protein